MAMEITKNTKISVSISMILMLGGFLWQAFVFAGQVKQNTRDIKSSELRDVKQDIRYYRTEQKKILMREEVTGETPLSKELKTDLGNSIKDLEKQEKCLTDGGDHCGG